MSPRISERAFEETIECALLTGGPDACADFGSVARETAPAYGEGVAGGYRRRTPEDYDRALCLLPRDALDFIYATQPKEWERLKQHHGAEVKERFLQRLSGEIEKRGALDVLRSGVRDSGCRFELAYFRPASGLNEELRRLYEANVYKRVTDDQAFAKFFLDWLFERLRTAVDSPGRPQNPTAQGKSSGT